MSDEAELDRTDSPARLRRNRIVVGVALRN
jgi:hypothetical protein